MGLFTWHIAFLCIISFHVLLKWKCFRAALQWHGFPNVDGDIPRKLIISVSNRSIWPEWRGFKTKCYKSVKTLGVSLVLCSIAAVHTSRFIFVLKVFLRRKWVTSFSLCLPSSHFWFPFCFWYVCRSARPRGASALSWRCSTARTAEASPAWDPAATTVSTSWRAAWQTRRIWTRSGICS